MLEVCPISYIAFIDAVVVSDDVRETTGEVVISSDAIVELIKRLCSKSGCRSCRVERFVI